jgi:hypothetical protein
MYIWLRWRIASDQYLYETTSKYIGIGPEEHNEKNQFPRF